MLHYLHLHVYTQSLILTKVAIQRTQPLVMTDMGAHTHVCLGLSVAGHLTQTHTAYQKRGHPGTLQVNT